MNVRGKRSFRTKPARGQKQDGSSDRIMLAEEQGGGEASEGRWVFSLNTTENATGKRSFLWTK